MIGEIIRKFHLRFLSKKEFAKYNYFLYDLALKGLGVGNCGSYSGEEWLANFLNKNYDIKVIFDVGANIGEYAAMFVDKNKEIYCFEPHPYTFQRLNDFVLAHKNIKAFNVGLSDKDGKNILYDHINRSGTTNASLYKEIITDLRNKEVEEFEIKLMTLDSFVKENEIKRLDMIKIDVEGNEMRVLKGAKKCISDLNIKVIQFEFDEFNVISRSFFKDYSEELKEYNFYRLLPFGLLPLSSYIPWHDEIFKYQNIVAIKKNITP